MTTSMGCVLISSQRVLHEQACNNPDGILTSVGCFYISLFMHMFYFKQMTLSEGQPCKTP